MENKIFVNEKIEKQYRKQGKEFLYLLQIGEVKDGLRRIKIGTTNDMSRRMKEHLKSYNENIYVLWCKPVNSKWTTLMKEENNKQVWRKEETDWHYLRNDRFDIPCDIVGVDVKIRKKYHVKFDCVCWEV